MKNATLQKYVDLSLKIIALEKEKEKIKIKIQSEGSFETNLFKVSVDTIHQTRVIDADALCVILSPIVVAEKGLLKEITFKKVSVKKK